tara:strand:+ start:883 stop:1125 length:243 start_codon:yes stop_codon:yes gene_type:complete
MKINISKGEMMMISVLINDFVYKKDDYLSETITPYGIKKLKSVELRMGEILIPEVRFSKKDKTEIYKKTVSDFFPDGYQE